MIRLLLEGNEVALEERLLESRGERIRDARVGPDGFPYALTDEANGSF